MKPLFEYGSIEAFLQTVKEKRNTDRKKSSFFSLLAMLFALSLAACGGGGSGGGAGSGGGSGSSVGGTSVVGSVILASQNSSNAYQLSSFPYEGNGTIPSGTPTATYNTFSSTPCTGSILLGGYDKSYGLLFIYTLPTSTTVNICVFSVSTGGAISYTGNSVSNLSAPTGYISIHSTNHYILVSQTSAPPNLYSYSSSGVISGTSASFSNLAGVNYTMADFVHNLAWGCLTTSACTSLTIAATFSSSFAITGTTSMNSGTLIASNDFKDDSSNLILFNNTNNNSTCTSTSTYEIEGWTYSSATGVFGNNPPSPLSIAGGCSAAYDSLGHSTDPVYKMIFVEGSTSVYPVTYTTANPPVLTSGTSISMSNPGDIVADFTNHFLINFSSSSSTLTNIVMNPYTTSGIQAAINSPTLSLGSYATTPSCTSGSSNCTGTVFAVIN